MPLFTSKITPAQQDQAVELKQDEENATDEVFGMRSTEIFFVLLHTVFRMYGGQRRPKIDSFKTLQNQGLLTEFRYVPRGATLIYISHE